MKWLVCGVGSVGRRHVRNLLALGERDILLYRQRNLPLDGPEGDLPASGDLDDLLARRPGAALITSPTSRHLPQALACARSGCHLLVEKPLSHDLAGLAELAAVVRENRLAVLMGFQFRFHPGLRRIKTWLAAGAIGRVVHVTAHWGERLSDWHPGEDFRAGYSAREDLGGGVVLTLCHPLDYLVWLLGPVRTVAALGGQSPCFDLPVEENAAIVLQFASGATGSVHLDYVQHPRRHGLEIVGCDGTIRWDDATGDTAVYSSGSGSWDVSPAPDGFQRNDMFLEEVRHFRDVVAGRAASLCPLDEGVANQRLLMAVKESLARGRVIRLDDPASDVPDPAGA
jgi:predicted dehydrogenase